jgi:hypothetical protein
VAPVDNPVCVVAAAAGELTLAREWCASTSAGGYVIHKAPRQARCAFDRPLRWVAYGGYAGFFGANRDALGFTSVADVGAGIESRIAPEREKSERLRVSAGYLFGDHVSGWTIGSSVQY